MIKQMLYVVLIGLLASSSSCEKSSGSKGVDSATLELNFAAVYDQQPLMMYAQEYPYEAGIQMKLQLFQFYISSVKLVDANGNEGPELLDVALVSFENVQSAEAAQKGISVMVDKVPVGNYTALKLGVGVNPVLNATQPSNYSAGHPLSQNYWSAASSYVFAKIEGNADLENDGQFEQKLTFHVGGNDRYRERNFEKTMALKSGNTEKINFSIDLKSVLVDSKSGEFVDFSKVTQIHDGSASTAVFIMDHLADGLILK